MQREESPFTRFQFRNHFSVSSVDRARFEILVYDASAVVILSIRCGEQLHRLM